MYFLKKYANYPFGNEELREIMLNYVAYQFVIFCANAYRIKDKTDRAYFKEQQKSLMFLLDYDLMPQTKAVKKVSGIIGYNLTDILLGIKARMMR